MQNFKQADHCNVESARQNFEQEDINRYSRQLILPEVGVTGQALLKKSSALIVGAGGLGCPAIQYLAAAGIGRIGVLDYDTIETSNLHRQVLHTESSARLNVTKASSAAAAVQKLNSTISVVEYCTQLNRDNAAKIIEQYDVVLDGTDNIVTRYLLNDICVLLEKPLVSGSALRWEGQLTTYIYQNCDGNKGPCYRCLYPKPAPPETVTNCSDGGVIGVVPGIIGCIQALEAIKIILNLPLGYCKKLLIFDGLSGTFRCIKLREAQLDCIVCGKSPTISLNNLPNYELFCGSSANDKCLSVNLLPAERRISALEYKDKYFGRTQSHILLDVREPIELEICSFPNAINISYRVLENCMTKTKNEKKKIDFFGSHLNALSTALKSANQKSDLKVIPVIVVCHLGNDSQKAVNFFDQFVDFDLPVQIFDIAGGVKTWAKSVDKAFFQY